MSAEQQQLQAAIEALEAQRPVLGDDAIEPLLAAARAQLSALGLPNNAAAAQQLRQVSILFLDIVGSTALSQHLDPEEIHDVMDGALARGTALVELHRGKVLQYAGDNLLAVFGADAAHEDDAESAVHCGLALLAEGKKLSAEVLALHCHAGFDVRVGLHTGGVLLGGGVDAKSSIRGIAVNIAARLEQTAPAGSLHISHDTYAQVRGLFEVQVQPPLQVKGVDAPVQSYLVRGAKPRSFRIVTRGIEGVATRMIGRGTELALLQDAFRQLFLPDTLHVAAQLFRRLWALAGAPVVLQLDDLHWADDESLDFLAQLAHANRDVAMLMLCFSRPTLFERRAQGWSFDGNHQRIDLGPLDAGLSRQLADELLKFLPTVPDPLKHLVAGRAEGNPFYMEELVKMLVDRGAIRTGQERWTLDAEKLLTTKVPTTLTGVLQARLDGLPAAERLTLQEASVIGAVFWDRALMALNPGADQTLPALVRRDLTPPRGESAPDGLREYAFKHQILHQVTYQTLLKRSRRELHGKLAHWLSRLTGLRADDYLAATAEHYELAGDESNAAEFHTRAAEQACARLANDTTLNHVQRALVLLDKIAKPAQPVRDETVASADLPLRWRPSRRATSPAPTRATWWPTSARRGRLLRLCPLTFERCRNFRVTPSLSTQAPGVRDAREHLKKARKAKAFDFPPIRLALAACAVNSHPPTAAARAA